MRIAHVITRLIVGGAQENTVLSCLGLRELGHEVVLICGPQTGREGSLWDWVDREKLPYRIVDSLRREIRPMMERRCLSDLAGVFNELSLDVVHTHSSKAGILGRRAAARVVPRPIIIHTIHGMSFNRTQAWPIRNVYRMLEKRAARVTDTFVSVADAMTDQCVAAKIAPRERFTTVYSGMEVERFAPNATARDRVRREWGIGPECIVVGTVARLFRNKGYEQILAALPAMAGGNDRVRFVWVGDGQHRGKYKAAVKQMGLADRVRFVGLVSPEIVGDCCNGFDILLHASRWEGLPRALPQALLCQVPAVSFDNDGAPEVVIPGQTGLLAPLGNINRLAESVLTLAGSAEMRERLGRAGRERCLAMFDHRRMVATLDQLYRRMAGHHRT